MVIQLTEAAGELFNKPNHPRMQSTKLHEKKMRQQESKTLCFYMIHFLTNIELVGVKKIPEGLQQAVLDMMGQILNGVLNSKSTYDKKLEHLRDVYTLISIELTPQSHKLT